MTLSVISPVYNEAKSLPQLVEELTAVLKNLKHEYEIILVDDCSKDDSARVMRELAQKKAHVKAVLFRAHKGQTAAIAAGIDVATGDVLVFIDSDLENDPADIPKLVAALEQADVDIASGWRVRRWDDQLMTRRLPSTLANKLVSRITKLQLHDHGCTLKAYRRELFEGVRLYGDMHRFIPAYLSWRGARVVEVPVNHRPRLYGKSNYGISRTFRVLLDLVVLKFLNTYQDRPMRFFGGAGLISLLLGFAAGLIAVVLRLLNLRHFVDTPLPVLSALFIIIGVQFILMGVLAEMVMRVYYESQDKKTYLVKEKVNL